MLKKLYALRTRFDIEQNDQDLQLSLKSFPCSPIPLFFHPLFPCTLYLHHESLLVKQLLLKVMLLHQMLVLLLCYHLLLLSLDVFRDTLNIYIQKLLVIERISWF